MKKNIWFNRWFRTGTDFIDLIKENDINNEYKFYITHHKNYADFIERADYFELDSKKKGKEYVDFCLEFCKKYSIDIFFPKYCLQDISKYRREFEDIGVKVLLAGSHETIDLVNHKVNFYEDCKKHNVVTIPEYRIVKTAQEFEMAFKELKNVVDVVCYKPVISEGGLDFRIINEDKKFPNISIENALNQMETKYKNREIMLMEYLDGIEYSIDCLAFEGKLLAAIPRKKIGWTRILEDNKELIRIAKELTEIYNFSYAYNVQVIFKNGIPKLLEVNPRMSGGLKTSCYSGINFPFNALELLIKGETTVAEPTFGTIIQTEEKLPARIKNTYEKN